MKKVGVLILLVVVSCKKLEEKGSIEGKVTNGDKKEQGIIVLAIEGDFLKSGTNINPNAVKAGVTNSEGEYKILLLEEGSYVVAGVKDMDGDYKYTDTVDMIGYYGKREGGIVVPTKVSLKKGENKKGINIDTLYVIPN